MNESCDETWLLEHLLSRFWFIFNWRHCIYSLLCRDRWRNFRLALARCRWFLRPNSCPGSSCLVVNPSCRQSTSASSASRAATHGRRLRTSQIPPKCRSMECCCRSTSSSGGAANEPSAMAMKKQKFKLIKNNLRQLTKFLLPNIFGGSGKHSAHFYASFSVHNFLMIGRMRNDSQWANASVVATRWQCCVYLIIDNNTLNPTPSYFDW